MTAAAAALTQRVQEGGWQVSAAERLHDEDADVGLFAWCPPPSPHPPHWMLHGRQWGRAEVSAKTDKFCPGAFGRSKVCTPAYAKFPSQRENKQFNQTDVLDRGGTAQSRRWEIFLTAN